MNVSERYRLHRSPEKTAINEEYYYLATHPSAECPKEVRDDEVMLLKVNGYQMYKLQQTASPCHEQGSHTVNEYQLIPIYIGSDYQRYLRKTCVYHFTQDYGLAYCFDKIDLISLQFLGYGGNYNTTMAMTHTSFPSQCPPKFMLGPGFTMHGRPKEEQAILARIMVERSSNPNCLEMAPFDPCLGANATYDNGEYNPNGQLVSFLKAYGSRKMRLHGCGLLIKWDRDLQRWRTVKGTPVGSGKCVESTHLMDIVPGSDELIEANEALVEELITLTKSSLKYQAEANHFGFVALRYWLEKRSLDDLGYYGEICTVPDTFEGQCAYIMEMEGATHIDDNKRIAHVKNVFGDTRNITVAKVSMVNYIRANCCEDALNLDNMSGRALELCKSPWPHELESFYGSFHEWSYPWCRYRIQDTSLVDCFFSELRARNNRHTDPNYIFVPANVLAAHNVEGRQALSRCEAEHIWLFLEKIFAMVINSIGSSAQTNAEDRLSLGRLVKEYHLNRLKVEINVLQCEKPPNCKSSDKNMIEFGELSKKTVRFTDSQTKEIMKAAVKLLYDCDAMFRLKNPTKQHNDLNQQQAMDFLDETRNQYIMKFLFFRLKLTQNMSPKDLTVNWNETNIENFYKRRWNIPYGGFLSTPLVRR